MFIDVLYWTKYVACIIGLRLQKRIQHKRFDLYDFEAINEPEKLAVLVPKEERILESPFPEEHLKRAADEIFIYGVNVKSQSLVVRVSRSCNDESEAWIYLKLSDGHWYELEQTKGYQRNFGDKCMSFTCGGLQMYYMNAMRRWRIVYCGMLRERKPNNEKKSVFVKFTFLWSASSDVFDFSCDLDTKVTAEAMARSKWNSLLPPINRVPKVLNFYAQSGVINGIVSIEDEPDIEMYLFGERIRHIGESEYLVGCKFKHILGVVPQSGLVLHLAKASYTNTFHNIQCGYIVHPNSQIYGIQDAAIISRMSGKDESLKSLTATFKGDKQYELEGNFVGDGLHFTSEQGWNGHLEMHEIKFDVDNYRGSGFMLSGEVSKLPDNFDQRKSPKTPSSLRKVRPLTVYFTDEASHSTDLTGGKGSSLGRLTKLSSEIKSEFIVPRGIIVTTAAYDAFLTSEIKEKIENLKNIAYGNTKGNIQEVCKVVQSAIERAYLPDKITKEIEEKLSKLFTGNINHTKVAVRSSATGEDTDQMSAAGQMDTFLGVKGLKEIFTAVKKCWASQFGYVATEYKRQNGQILNSPMAVVIQEMVECEAAGVLFTCDPVTSNPSVSVITGNYGLGESVVSGSEEPDTIVLEKLSHDELRVKSMTVGLKQHRIVLTDATLSEEDGTITEDVPEDQRNQCCIPEKIAIQLGKLSLKIEKYFKSPRDIEWGIKSDTIYILQSRPITTGGSISDHEIKHEFDAPLRCEEDFVTKCNVGEVMPGASSPLGIDVMVKYFSLVGQRKIMKSKQRNNFLQSKYYQSGIVSFYNHVHMSVLDLLTRFDDLDSFEAQSMMMAIFGRLLDYPELKVLLNQRSYKKLKTSIRDKLDFFGNLFFSGWNIEKVKNAVFNYQISAESGKTSKEIFDLNVNCCSDFAESLLIHAICTDMSSLWNMIMFGILAKANGGIDNDVYGDFAKLLASSSNVESADVPAAIQRLAQAIVQDIKGDEFRMLSIEDAQDWLQTSTGLAGYEYRQFMKRHGHRCLKEFDIHTMPWNRDPKSLIKLLQNMSKTCGDVTEKKEEDLSNILPHLSIHLSLKDRLLLKFILPNCRRGVREREACKSNLIKAMDNIKKGYQHLSNAMVAEGYLPDSDLMYFLTIDEIYDVLETRNPRHIARANHRRRLFPYLDSLIFQDISKGRPIPVNEQNEEVEYVADLTMKGIPVSQGTVKGYARIALSLDDASHLKPGEILITYSTDIGWSPYFPFLGGVVTELGGLISHGAVVSREYGLPCVVGLHGATKQFVTGDYVLLDGNKGLLQRVSPPES